jgi:hypothetical protein
LSTPARGGEGPHLDHQRLWLALELLVLQHLHRASLNNTAPKEDLSGEVQRIKDNSGERYEIGEEQLASVKTPHSFQTHAYAQPWLPQF